MLQRREGEDWGRAEGRGQEADFKLHDSCPKNLLARLRQLLEAWGILALAFQVMFQISRTAFQIAKKLF